MPRKAKRYAPRRFRLRSKYSKMKAHGDESNGSDDSSIISDNSVQEESAKSTHTSRELACFQADDEVDSLTFRPLYTSSPIPFDASSSSESVSCDVENDSDLESDDNLYDGAGIKVRVYTEELFQIATHLKLSDAGIGMINDFIAGILPCPNKCPTKHQLLKTDEVEFEYQVNVKTVDDGIYYTLNITEQLEGIIRRHTEILSVQRVQSDNLCDIFDGKAFRNLSVAESECDYIYCLLNCDGIASVHKSKQSKIWPVSLVVLNLAPLKRRKFENIILSVLYFGKKKPDFNILLQEVRNAIELVRIEDNGRIVKIKVLALVADLPAKADCLNMVAFNGYYGCSTCEEKGCYLLQHHKMAYPITGENARIRDAQSHAEHVNNATKAKPLFGVKGGTPLSDMMDIPSAAPFDPMHLIYLGVTRTITLYAIKKNLIDCNAASLLMQNATIPKYFNRFPRNLENISLWKASDWRAFLLYSSVPVACHSISHSPMSEVILTLFVCLSTFVHLLSSEDISEEDIQNAARLVEVFQKTLQNKFGFGSMSFSVHALKHIPEQVRQFGPLWTHSAFCFESFFGHLTRLVSGTVNEAKLMVRRFLRFHCQLSRRQPRDLAPGDAVVKDDDGVMALKRWRMMCDNDVDGSASYFNGVVVNGRKFATDSKKSAKSRTTLSLAVSRKQNRNFVKIKKIYYQPGAGFFCMVEKFSSQPALHEIVSLPNEILNTLQDTKCCAILSTGSTCVLKCSTLENHFVSFHCELVPGT